MLKLLVEKEVTSPTVILRWCIERAEIELMSQLGVKKPYLLIAINAGYSREHILVPLDHLEEYIQLRHPGESKIFAAIVWNEKGYKALWKEFLYKKNGQYQTTVLAWDEESKIFFNPPENCIGAADLTIEVPKALFAKEPPRWEKRWVNLWHENAAKDQCQFRRRRIFAYTIQPPLMLIWAIVVKILPRWTFAGMLVAFGLWFDFDDKWSPKKWKPLLNLSPLVHPWSEDFREISTQAFRTLHRENGPFMLLNSVFLMPIVLVLFYLFVALGFILRPSLSYIGKYAGRGLSSLAEFIAAKIDKWIETKEAANAQQPALSAEAVRVDYERKQVVYNPLLCENIDRVDPKKVVPFKHKIHLYYNDLKSMVCKPFAG